MENYYKSSKASDESSDTLVIEKKKTKTPRNYVVIFHNDDFTTQEFVIHILMNFFYKNQEDEQKLLENNGKLFLSLTRKEAIQNAINENYEVAILDDGIQDKSITYDLSFICFNNIVSKNSSFKMLFFPTNSAPNRSP